MFGLLPLEQNHKIEPKKKKKKKVTAQDCCFLLIKFGKVLLLVVISGWMDGFFFATKLGLLYVRTSIEATSKPT